MHVGERLKDYLIPQMSSDEVWEIHRENIHRPLKDVEDPKRNFLIVINLTTENFFKTHPQKQFL